MALDAVASGAILRGWLQQALLLEAIARDSIGDPDCASAALERALELAERDRFLLPFLVHPVPALLERYARHRTDHADLVGELLRLIGVDDRVSPVHATRSPRDELLTESEARVLRFLPTNLSKREIADELYVSLNTVKTHVKHIYAKLDVQTRRQAVERASALGILS